MAQVLEFKLPDLGEGLTEAEIVRWLVEVGDVVAVDQPVVEVETAKAMVEVPCPYGGVVTARFGEEGTELPVGSPLLTVAVGGDAPASGGADEGSGNVLVGYGTGAPPARRRRVRTSPVAPVRPAGGALSNGGSTAAARGADGTSGPLGTGRGSGARTAAPDRTDARGLTDGRGPTDARGRGNAGARATGPVPVISPLVRRIARENGLDLRELTGSGPDGLILRADVEHASRSAEGITRQPETLAVPRTPGTTPAAAADGTRVPLRGIRGAVADKLSRSRHEIPDATCWVDADATELLAARAAMNAAGGPKISLLALLARICTAALARHPELNSTVDMEAREIVRLGHVHLGFAAQTERGLVVPVVRDAHTRDAQSLSAEFARLTEAARTGTLTPGDLTGGTFTLNNYGVFGVDGSTPIINHPEAAMLGVGRIIPKPWVHQGELAVRQVVQLSLTFDHRVCDGGTAGGFLRYVADCVEQPAVLLRSL
ncbi:MULTISPECIES: dihydrolipoamide acetyltransferase family protein [unclassified Streptomyces]|uniref:dihydrolipoamide acetyltransferase family protein n=1 Tax=unclassified Streptomyces TaxID=2593676 RepID=UPI00143ECD0D|nr:MULTISPECIES: dihydrolipoamide acetyltransferase family protein [unclassified Streptomyces]QIY63705.1 2-oxo acid dehydrogenase subunit E2 [Streptomyces sp. RPA4-2]